MMEDELRLLLREHGWNLFKRKRGKQEYFYAQRWKKGEIYITSIRNLPKLKPDQVIEKLAAVA